jgi:hypothetical protein
MKNIKLDKVSIIILSALLLILVSCSMEKNKVTPVAVNGIIDLNGWNFNTDGSLELRGEWKFLLNERGKDYHLEDFNDSGWDNFHVPGIWNFRTNSGFGYGWFRLKIINISGKDLAVYLNKIASSYKMYINSDLFISVGEPGETREISTPKTLIGGICWTRAEIKSSPSYTLKFSPKYSLYFVLNRTLLLKGSYLIFFKESGGRTRYCAMDSLVLTSEPYNRRLASIENPEFFQLSRLEAKAFVISSPSRKNRITLHLKTSTILLKA